jgi:hypothetical protein
MLDCAAITLLIVSGLLSAAAIAAFSWSVATARVVLPCAIVAATMGLLVVGLDGGFSALKLWAFVFTFGSCGCNWNAARNLFARPTRWIHRFVIYAGYGTTFTGMGAAALWLESRVVSGWLAIGVLIAIYVLGSVGIFLAKTVTLRHIAKTMPEYHASLAAGQDGFGYW